MKLPHAYPDPVYFPPEPKHEAEGEQFATVLLILAALAVIVTAWLVLS